MEQNGTSNGSCDSKNWKKFPFEMSMVDGITEKQILKHFKGPLAGMSRIGSDEWRLSKHFIEYADEVYNFQARHDDIYVSTFIRSGTTWTQEMIWLLCNDLNYEASKATKLDWRFPFLEFESTFPKDMSIDFPQDMVKSFPPPALDFLPKMTSQRYIKTHLPIILMPYSALEQNCKIVYVARNPKDVIVSSFHFAHNLGYLYEGTFEQFVDCFMENMLAWSPYFEHIKDGWSRRNDKNVLFLFYENLVMDLEGSLKKLAKFLERPLSDEDLPGLMNHLNIMNFKDNTAVNHDELKKLSPVKYDFVRRGQVGGNPEMTPEIAEKIDVWTEQQLSGSDLKFPHQLRHKMEMYKLEINRQFKK